MLSLLNVKNLGIVAAVNIEFGAGLNIITGETGAGKSLLIDALSIIRGARVSSQSLGPFGDAGSVTAVFRLPLSHKIFQKLTHLDLDENEPGSEALKPLKISDSKPLKHSKAGAALGEVIVRRVFQSNGRTKNFVNDVPVHLRTLVEVTSELVDISSQFANQRLLDERSHVTYLDSFGKITSKREDYESLFLEILGELGQLGQMARRKFELAMEKDLLESEVSDLEELNPSEAEFIALRESVHQFEKMARATRELSELSARLSEADGGCNQTLRHVEKRLLQLSTSYPHGYWEGGVEAIKRARLEAEDASFQIDKLIEEFGGSSLEVEEKKQRLEQYHKLMSRFGVGVGQLSGYAATARARLEELSGLDFKIKELQRTLSAKMRLCSHKAKELTSLRQALVRGLCKAVEHELSALGMPKARFFVELQSHDQTQPILFPHLETLLRLRSDSDFSVDEFLLLARSGAERVRFVLAPNPGSSGGPLKDVASGGELSRLMLSIKTVLFESETMSVFVFDEIDTGISGQVASKVGAKLASFCKTRQAIVVTHLPQVACFGKHHFIVSKSMKKDKTSTQIVLADASQREKELAQMISGVKLSEQSVAQAKLLLHEAEMKEGKTL